MYVAIAKRLDAGEIQERETKEQGVIEASIRARAQGVDVPPIDSSATANGFGSSLDQNDTVRRARSRTMSSGGEGDVPRTAGGVVGMNGGNDDVHLLRQLSLSSHDRQTLEQEMRAQHTHPLALQMEAEAQERRQNNELEYYRNNPQRSRDAALVRARMMGTPNGAMNGSLRTRFTRTNSSGGRSSRRWNGEFGSADANSLDDMVVLEAALMLSMEEEARSQGPNGGGRAANSGPPPSRQPAAMPTMHQFLGPDSTIGGSGRRFGGPTRSMSATPSFSRGGLLSEDEQVAMAIAISMEEQQDSSQGSNKDDEESDKGDSKPQARRGRGRGGQTPPESAPPKSAISSAPSSSGVASLPIVSEDDDDCINDNEEEIVFSKLSPKVTGKSSLDDSAYFRKQEDGGGSVGNRKEIPDRTLRDLKEETMEMPLATVATTSRSEDEVET
mmetsp:Transcript_9631/g.16031  ORF Transcript_9631/g.16031 Transcript_9631/m.16031 type:complete len:443 (-) Transcript_9631:86-1414(-)